mmetsp:Transcript_13783/g.27505  ORF Transcript_13783/g.27505 Transcript_13783/m.27505 type:complete len:187 (+) Transcript_13783:91-651(+)
MFRPISFLLVLLGAVHGTHIEIDWECGRYATPRTSGTYKVEVGDVVKFVQNGGHNVFSMVDAAAYEKCSFKGGTLLADGIDYIIPIVEEDVGQIMYLGCEYYGHCDEGGMKLPLEVFEAPRKKKCNPKKLKKQYAKKFVHVNNHLRTCKWLQRKTEKKKWLKTKFCQDSWSSRNGFKICKSWCTCR